MSDEDSGLYEISDEEYRQMKEGGRKVVGIFAREARKAETTIREQENALISMLFELTGKSMDVEELNMFEAQEKGLDYQAAQDAFLAWKTDFFKLEDKRSDDEIKANITRLEQQIKRARLEKDLDA